MFFKKYRERKRLEHLNEMYKLFAEAGVRDSENYLPETMRPITDKDLQFLDGKDYRWKVNSIYGFEVYFYKK